MADKTHRKDIFLKEILGECPFPYYQSNKNDKLEKINTSTITALGATTTKETKIIFIRDVHENMAAFYNISKIIYKNADIFI